MPKKGKVEFCTNCRKDCAYQLKKKTIKKTIREEEYDFEITVAVCECCGEEIWIPGLLELNAEEVDQQYRKKENIVSVKDIENLMDIYNIGKAPLSTALGFGEITITRYLLGQVPSKEYSDIIKKALTLPKYMIELLNENAEKIGATAYKKAKKAAEEIAGLFVMSEKMLLTISYIFDQMQEVTPLALQKLLYFIQGIYMVKYGEPFYPENCQAWVHGPVYEEVYNLFKDFKYNPIEDNRFAIFKSRFEELSEQEREIIDLVIKSFGMYSGKTLERITHKEGPWCDARIGYAATESSNEIITKESIYDYFKDISEKYGIDTEEHINEYIKYCFTN